MGQLEPLKRHKSADGQCISTKYFYITSVEASNDLALQLDYVPFQPLLSWDTCTLSSSFDILSILLAIDMAT